jgi:hypothetical protein
MSDDDKIKEFLFGKELKGLFQTNYKMGMVIAVIEDKNGVNQYTPIPCFNDCRGENTALNLMKEPDFKSWAIDPWTGVVNLQIV